MTPGYNRFGFATGSSPNFQSGSSSFSTRRGDSLFTSSSSTTSKYDKNRKGYDRGVDNESLYRPITLKGSLLSSSNGGLYSGIRDKYSGSRYGTTGGGSGSSLGSSNNDKDYRPRPHAYEGLSGSTGGSNNDKSLSLSQMLDMSATNGDNLDLQHKMQIQELLYSNSSRLNEDARQMSSGLYEKNGERNQSSNRPQIT